MTTINKYQNGNTEVTIFSDGTKTREYFDTPFVDHPESIDVKITDYCDMGCSYCHESSTVSGVHGDLVKLLEIIKPLPSGVELAIGGGNPLVHPGLVPFLFSLRSRRLMKIYLAILYENGRPPNVLAARDSDTLADKLYT